MESNEYRRLSIDASVDTILSSGGPQSPKQSSPAESIGPSLNHASRMSPPPRPDPARARPLSLQSRNTNRLSLNFPIQLPEASSTKQSPVSSGPSTGIFAPGSDVAPAVTPKDSGAFLVALAAQERRVLELKEELLRAEGHLTTLKRQWAVHEANKKRVEIKNVGQLQPLHTLENTHGSESLDRRSLELGRRKAILEGVKKDSRRRIMTGGHTRTLSLLSPVRSTSDFPPLSTASDAGSEYSDSNSVIMPRSTTMPDTSQGLSKIHSNRARHSYQGSATNGIKQVAEDIKAGLWTFMEDLRQATVGEEAVQASAKNLNATPTRLNNKLSKGSLRSTERLQSHNGGRGKSSSKHRDSGRSNYGQLADPSKSSNFDPLTPLPKERKLDVPAPELLDDDWSNWDSPVSNCESPRWSGSTAPTSDGAEVVENSHSRIKADATATPIKGDEMPWPALNDFSPSNLKRTASAIIQEWEKSLTPPPDRRKYPLPSAVKASDEDHEVRLSLTNLP